MRNNFSIKLSYIRNLFAKEYKKIEEYCILEKKQHIQIGPEEGKLLSLFIKSKIKSIVEIGTLYGYSSICMDKSSTKRRSYIYNRK